MVSTIHRFDKAEPQPPVRPAARGPRTCGVGAFIALILATILFPPLGVLFVAGWELDVFINIILSLLGYIPAIVHALYIIFVYQDRRSRGPENLALCRPAPGVFSPSVQQGGGYGHTQHR